MSRFFERLMWWLMKPWMLYVLVLTATPAFAQVSGPPFVYVAGTVISPDEVNLNFSTVYAAALNRAGGTMTGNLLFSADNTLDIGASGVTRPRDLFLGRNAAIGGTLGVTGATTLAALSATTGSFSSTLGVAGVSTLAALSATTGTFSSTLAVTGATTLSAALGGTAATFSGTVTGNLFSGSGASLTSIPETAITDGSLLARVGSTETISGAWTFTAGIISSSVNANVVINNTAATADNRTWLLRTVGDEFRFTVCNDATSVCNDPWTVTRSGTTPTGMTISTALALSNTISPSALGGDVNDYSPTGLAAAYLLRVSASGATRTINGLATGTAGRQLSLCNVGLTESVQIANENAGSAAANRFALSLASFLMPPGDCREFLYDGTSSRWRLKS